MKVFLIILSIVLALLVLYFILKAIRGEKVVLQGVTKNECAYVNGIFVTTQSGQQAGATIGALAGLAALIAGVPGLVPAGAQIGGGIGSKFQKGTCTYYKK